MTAEETLAEYKELKERNVAVIPRRNEDWGYPICVKCNSDLHRMTPFCPYCGQRLCWEGWK